MSYYDEKVARALGDIAKELKGIGRTLKSIDKRLAEQNEPDENEAFDDCMCDWTESTCTHCVPGECPYRFTVEGAENG